MTESNFATNPNINQRAAANPADSVWVAASAGSGKTKVLADRVLNLFLSGVKPERILCLTFTKAAAAQMENRIAKKLSGWAAEPEEKVRQDLFMLKGEEPDAKTVRQARRLFAKMLDAQGGMKILTIHSFCQSLLKRFPLEAGVVPSFVVMDEGDAKVLMEEVILKCINAKDLREDIKEVSLYADEEELIKTLKSLDNSRAKFAGVKAAYGSVDNLLVKMKQKCGLKENTSVDDIVEKIIKVPEWLGVWAEKLAADSGKTNYIKGQKLQWFMSLPEAEKKRNYREYVLAFLTGEDTVRKDQVFGTLKEELSPPMQTEAERIYELLQDYKTLLSLQAAAAFLRIADTVLVGYENEKKHKGLLDYNDLILKAKNLLYGENAAAWVLYKLDGGIDHILVDEAQDTSAEQWDIVKALTGEFFAGEGANPNPRTVFAVGDKKQSIFSFQGANPLKFAANKAYFEGQLLGVEKTLKVVPLTVSFRSVKAILDLVNTLLKNPEVAAGVTDEGEEVVHIPYRQGMAGFVEMWESARGDEDEAAEKEKWEMPLDTSNPLGAKEKLAGKIAALIKQMTEGEILESEGRKIRPADIMILLRKRSAFFEMLVRELKKRGVPVTGLDRMQIKEQIAVMDLVALGNFALLPEDDLNLAGLLKSPMFGLSEDELYSLCYNRGKRPLWEVLRLAAEGAAADSAIAKAKEKLVALLDMADTVTPYYFYGYVLGAMGARRQILARLGYDADDAILEFMNLILDFEKDNVPSLQGFLAWLARREIEVKRDLEQGDINAVKITTVHSSKGLEAPIVFLPDTKTGMGGDREKLFWINEGEIKVPFWCASADGLSEVLRAEREGAKAEAEEEARRLLYVAVTRPRDRLYIGAWDKKGSAAKADGKEKKPKKSAAEKRKNWYELLQNAFETAGAEKIKDERFGEVLKIACPQEKENKKEVVEKLVRPVVAPLWARTVAADEPTPPKPLAPSKFGGEDEEVTVPSLSDMRKKALKKGEVVHRLLQLLPEVAGDKWADFIAKFLAKEQDFSAEEKEEIAGQVLGILHDESLAPLFGKNSRAEVPIIGMLDDKVFSGQVDRLAVTADEVLVVDYKTNAVVPQKLDDVPVVYKTQMTVYKKMLEKVFKDKKIRAFLLFTKEAKKIEV